MNAGRFVEFQMREEYGDGTPCAVCEEASWLRQWRFWIVYLDRESPPEQHDVVVCPTHLDSYPSRMIRAVNLTE